jgi:hypothetical protein
LKFVLDTSVHSSPLWNRSVVLHYDFRIGVQPLQLSNELDAIACVALGIFRVSEDDGELRNDVKAANALGQRQRVFGA